MLGSYSLCCFYFAVLVDVRGKSGDSSLTAWAGEAFKTYSNITLALEACINTNKFYKNASISNFAYIAEGTLNETGFHKSDCI